MMGIDVWACHAQTSESVDVVHSPAAVWCWSRLIILFHFFPLCHQQHSQCLKYQHFFFHFIITLSSSRINIFRFRFDGRLSFLINVAWWNAKIRFMFIDRLRFKVFDYLFAHCSSKRDEGKSKNESFWILEENLHFHFLGWRTNLAFDVRKVRLKRKIIAFAEWRKKITVAAESYMCRFVSLSYSSHEILLYSPPSSDFSELEDLKPCGSTATERWKENEKKKRRRTFLFLTSSREKVSKCDWLWTNFRDNFLPRRFNAEHLPQRDTVSFFSHLFSRVITQHNNEQHALAVLNTWRWRKNIRSRTL